MRGSAAAGREILQSLWISDPRGARCWTWFRRCRGERGGVDLLLQVRLRQSAWHQVLQGCGIERVQGPPLPERRTRFAQDAVFRSCAARSTPTVRGAALGRDHRSRSSWLRPRRPSTKRGWPLLFFSTHERFAGDPKELGATKISRARDRRVHVVQALASPTRIVH